MISGNIDLIKAPVRNIGAKVELYKGSTDATKSGNYVFIDDAYLLKHDVGIQLKGKNLIDFFNINAQEAYTYISKDGTTTYTKDGYLLKDLTVGEKYTLSFTFNDDSNICSYVYFYKFNRETNNYITSIYITTNTILENPYTFTVEENTDYLLCRGGTYSITQTEINKFATFQLEQGATATEYEPYITDYSNNEVVRVGKNLARLRPTKTETFTGITSTYDENGIFTINGTATIDFTNAYLTPYLKAQHGEKIRLPAGTYSISITQYGGSFEGYYGMAITNSQGTTYPTVSKKLVLTEESQVSIYVQFRLGKSADNLKISLQIEKGEATEYDPYAEQRVAPNIDGSVSGITSLPNMMLYNTSGILMNIDYQIPVDNATLSSTDDLNSITIDRIGESKFFGYGISQKANIRIRDIERNYTISTANFFKLYFNDICAFPYMYVTEVHRDENTNELSITVYDRLEKAAKHTVNELNLFSYTIGEFAEACGALLGLETSLPALEEFGLSYEEGANFEGTETIREALNDIAEATQTIYYINADNQLTFKRLDMSGDPLLTIGKEDYITLDSKTNRRLAGICSATELGDNVEAKLEQSGTTQYIRDNAFWELREDIADLVDNALAAIGGFTINQFSCNWRGNYLVEIGDKIALVTKDNETVISYLLNDTITYNGAFYQNTQWQYNDEAATATNPTSLGEVLKQTYAKVDKQNKEISMVASEAAANASAISTLELNTQSINATVEGIKTQTDTNTGELTKLNKKVSAQITPEQMSLEIQKAIDNGVNKVETKTGFTFNDEGLTVTKSDSEMKTQITEDGMQVFRGSQEVLTANNEGIKAVDLHATTYLIVGDYSRFENYPGKKRTACFWIGG